MKLIVINIQKCKILIFSLWKYFGNGIVEMIQIDIASNCPRFVSMIMYEANEPKWLCLHLLYVLNSFSPIVYITFLNKVDKSILIKIEQSSSNRIIIQKDFLFIKEMKYNFKVT